MEKEKDELKKRVTKLEKSLEKLQTQINKPKEPKRECNLSKFISVSEVLSEDERLQYIVVGTLYHAMNYTGIVDINCCDDIREEFMKRGWIALSKNDVQDTPYQEWHWYIISVIFRIAYRKAINAVNTAHTLYYNATHPTYKTSEELIAEFDNITKNKENETKDN